MVALARDQYDLANTQFELGTGTSQALLTASVALSAAEAGLEQAKNNLALGILALQNAMGE
jgi:outer membrane protein TolC